MNFGICMRRILSKPLMENDEQELELTYRS